MLCMMEISKQTCADFVMENECGAARLFFIFVLFKSREFLICSNIVQNRALEYFASMVKNEIGEKRTLCKDRVDGIKEVLCLS